MGQLNVNNRTLFISDNLPILEGMNSETVDLILIDPPFNKKRQFQGIGKASKAKFNDTWTWRENVHPEWMPKMREHNRALVEVIESAYHAHDPGMAAYIAWMSIRTLEMQRILKPTGSMYLHCDPTASHYLKAMMDAVFGSKQFRNEVVWDYSFRLMDLPRFFNRKHDLVLFYAKGLESQFTMPKTPWTREEIIRTRKQKIHKDEYGEEVIWMPGGRGNSKSKLKRISDIIAEGKAVSDVWSMPTISSSSKERIGWPTQKPLSLYSRIIKASSNEGDLVLDAFAGCATTCVAAEQLGRQWVGIDIDDEAAEVTVDRLRNEVGFFGEVVVRREPPIRTPDAPPPPSFKTPKRRKASIPMPPLSEARKVLATRDGTFCQGCGFEPPKGLLDFLEVDHKLPKADGGTNAYDNLCLLCAPCNRRKSHILTLSGLRRENRKEDRMLGNYW